MNACAKSKDKIMTHYGKIHSYDTGKGSGMITPEKGGDALAFSKADLKGDAAEPMAAPGPAHALRPGLLPYRFSRH